MCARQSASIVVHAAYTRDVFDGSKPDKIEDFQAEFADVSFEQFAHTTSVVRRSTALLSPSAAPPVLEPSTFHVCGKKAPVQPCLLCTCCMTAARVAISRSAADGRGCMHACMRADRVIRLPVPQ